MKTGALKMYEIDVRENHPRTGSTRMTTRFLYECTECGASVHDEVAHGDFHRRLNASVRVPSVTASTGPTTIGVSMNLLAHMEQIIRDNGGPMTKIYLIKALRTRSGCGLREGVDAINLGIEAHILELNTTTGGIGLPPKV